MLAFVLGFVLIASGAFLPAEAFPCNNCINGALTSYNVTHDITVNNVVRVPPFNNRKAVAVGEFTEPKAVAAPENRPEEKSGLATEPSGGRNKKCGTPPAQSQAPVDSSPAQVGSQDDAGLQVQPSGGVPGSQEQPQEPPKKQSSNGPRRKKCKTPSSKSKSPVESQEKPPPPAEEKPKDKPVRKPCKSAPEPPKSSAENQEQPAVTQPSNGNGSGKSVEEQTKSSTVDNQPVENPQQQEEPPKEGDKAVESVNTPPSKGKEESDEGATEQQATAPRQPCPQGPADQDKKPAATPEKPVTEPEKPATGPEKPTTEPKKPVTEPEKPVTEPEKPVAEPEKPVAEPEKPVAEPEKPAKEPEKPATEPKKPAKEPEKPAGNSGSSQGRPGGKMMATAHVQYSSSIGVLGCKGVDLSRIAFFPGTPGCDDICVKVTYEGRSVNLLRIDSSGSAPSPDNSGTFDMSCQAYDFLVHGTDNKNSCKTGDRTPMSYETVDPEQCKHLLNGGVLPISAPNPNYYVECANSPTFTQGSLKLALFNINDARCQHGIDEECSWSGVGDPTCPSGLGQGNTRQLQGLEITDPSYGG